MFEKWNEFHSQRVSIAAGLEVPHATPVSSPLHPWPSINSPTYCPRFCSLYHFATHSVFLYLLYVSCCLGLFGAS